MSSTFFPIFPLSKNVFWSPMNLIRSHNFSLNGREKFTNFYCQLIENKKYISFLRKGKKVSPKTIASCLNCWYNLQRWGFLELYTGLIPLPKFVCLASSD